MVIAKSYFSSEIIIHPSSNFNLLALEIDYTSDEGECSLNFKTQTTMKAISYEYLEAML